jgi:transcriptional regulator with XRE-family HTH domain
MPEIIDNVKVGQFIKEQLKDSKITQDVLAQKLNITKTAVSQNLNGKSTFSRKNLQVIADLLEMKLEDLLQCKRREDDNFDSEYQKFARKGLAEFKRNYAKDVVINEPDIYGKVLVDYLVDEDVEDIFIYLHDAETEFVKHHFHRAKDIYLKIISYCLKKNLPATIRYIKLFSELNNSFDISLYDQAEEIWKMINVESNRYLIEEMMELKINQEYKVFGFKNSKLVKALTKNLWLDTLAKYKLAIVLNVYLDYYGNPDDFYDFTKVMFKEKFPKGIEIFVKKFFSGEVSLNKRSSYRFQRVINLVIEDGHFTLFKKFVSNKIYENLTDIIIKAIDSDQDKYYEYCLSLEKNNFDIDYKKVGLLAVKKNMRSILEIIINELDEKEKNYLLSEVTNNDLEMMKYLFHHGARFDFDFYNAHMMKDANLLLEHLSEKEGE